MISRTSARFAIAFTVALFVTLSFVAALKPAAPAQAFSSVSADVQCPSFAGLSSTVVVTVSVIGGPAADVGGSYGYKDVSMAGTNTTGWKAEPLSQSSVNGIFRINLTMPGEAGQTVKVSLNATSKDLNGENETYTTTVFNIKVVEPIVINATVYNKGDTDATNVTLDIYADGNLLDSQTINVSAGSSEAISYNWTFSSIRSGKHVITIKVNDPASLVEFNDGNNDYSLTIYIGNQGNPAGAILTGGLIVVIILFVLTYLQKPIRRGKKT